MDCECFYFHKSNLKRITAWEGSQRMGRRAAGARALCWSGLPKEVSFPEVWYISVIANVFVIIVRRDMPKLTLAHVVCLSN